MSLMVVGFSPVGFKWNPSLEINIIMSCPFAARNLFCIYVPPFIFPQQLKALGSQPR